MIFCFVDGRAYPSPGLPYGNLRGPRSHGSDRESREFCVRLFSGCLSAPSPSFLSTQPPLLLKDIQPSKV